MIALKMISERITAWLWNREAAREWVQFSDPELCPIRIRRSDFEDVVRRRRTDTMVNCCSQPSSLSRHSPPLRSMESDGGYVAPERSKPAPGRLLDQDYLASTGETVPRPGVPQSSGDTPFDRYMRQQNDRIDNSICSGC